MEWKLYSLLLLFIFTPEYQSLPLDLEHSRSTSNVLHSSSNAIVRVIASSSSYRSSAGQSSYSHTTHHNPPHSTTSTPPPSEFQPTTYHPRFPKFPHFPHSDQECLQGHSPRSSMELKMQPFSFNKPLQLEQQPTDLFSVFYHAFSNHKSAESFSLPVRPSAPTLPLLPPIVSVVSKSQSVSASETTKANQRKRLQKTVHNTPLIQIHTSDRASDERSLEYQVPEPQRLRQDFTKGEDVDEALDDAFMIQADQPHEPPEPSADEMKTPVTNSEVQEKVWGEPEKVWGEPEKVWGEPEKVWGEPEKNWGEPEKVWGEPVRNWEVSGKWEPQKEVAEFQARKSPNSDHTKIPEADTENDGAVRFYELGEDEDDEPTELILDKNAMQTTIETAQLAARSWELPELTHLSMIPNNSFIRTSVDGMTSESVQIPFSTNAVMMPKVRMTLDTGVPRAKSIVNSRPESPALSEGSNGKKFGYVLDGSNVRKYRVEERTPDGYIVGEYGVLNHNNGFLHGVRYTADGTINPRLIHEALMKFLSL